MNAHEYRTPAGSDRPNLPARIVLYLYLVLVACPIRYWPLGLDVDETWQFALNYAAAHGLTAGRDVVFNYGPLAYLLFPMNIGGNLLQGLVFQTLLWIALALILADIVFRSGLPLRNLVVFSIAFGLTAPWFWFNYAGAENLMVAAALLLITMYRVRGGWVRYLAALCIVGLLPLFKLTAGMVGFAALAGFAVEAVIEHRRKALPLVALTVVVPVGVFLALGTAVIRPASALIPFLRGSLEIAAGYSAAMSVAGSGMDFLAAAAILALLIWILSAEAATSVGMARFHALLLAVPLFVSFKHGFVRQDGHVISFFCFVSLAVGLVGLSVSLRRAALPYLLALAILPWLVWRDYLGRVSLVPGVAESTGVRQALMLKGVLPFRELQRQLDSTVAGFPPGLRLEPDIVTAIGDSPVASLSKAFTNLAPARLRIEIYPVFQRYQANTQYLDDLNAAWIRERGPRFLVFDGKSIDHRDAWAESPATWLEVYRWYDTHLLGVRNLLLERRSAPRFQALQTLSTQRMSFPGEFQLPLSPAPLFWTLHCKSSVEGQLRKLLFRIPEVTLGVQTVDGAKRISRVIPSVLVSPTPAALPATLTQFADLFRGQSTAPVDRLWFAGEGAASYSGTCEISLLRPAVENAARRKPGD